MYISSNGVRQVLFLMVFAALGMAFSSGPAWSADEDNIKLPDPVTKGGMPLMDALTVRQSTRSFSKKPLPLQTISNLLWAGFGINRPEEGKRTAPSSYNWQDITVYVFLPEAVYTYDAKGNRLVLVKKGDQRKLAGMQGYVWEAPLSLVLVSDFSKMERKGQTFSLEYKKSMGAIDAGLILQNVYLYCAANKLGCVARASVDKKQFVQALKLPSHMEVIVGQTVGYKDEED